MILVSILVPVYNGESTLQKCIQSVLVQTYHQIELIIVIDGSPDKSHQLALEIQKKDKRIKVINQTNHGLAATRRIAFEDSHGDFIYHLDQDDYLEPNAIEKLLEVIKVYNADIAVCGSIFQDISGEKITEWISHSKGESQVDYLNAIFKSELQHNIWGKLIKRKIFKKVKGINNTGGEDYLALIMMIAYNPGIKIICTPDILHHYIVDNNSLTHSLSGSEYFKFTNHIEEILVQTGLENDVFDAWSRFRVVNCWRRYLRKGEKDLLRDHNFLNKLYGKYYNHIKGELSYFERLELILYKYNYMVASLFSKVYSKIG